MEKHTRILDSRKIDYQVSRTPLVTSTAWTTSDTMALKKEKNFKTTITTVSALGVNNDLPCTIMPVTQSAIVSMR